MTDCHQPWCLTDIIFTLSLTLWWHVLATDGVSECLWPLIVAWWQLLCSEQGRGGGGETGPRATGCCHHPATSGQCQWSEEAAPAVLGAGTWQLTPEPETGRGPGSGLWLHHKSSEARVESVIRDRCPDLCTVSEGQWDREKSSVLKMLVSVDT